MRRAATLLVALLVLGPVAGCGGPGPSPSATAVHGLEVRVTPEAALDAARRITGDPLDDAVVELMPPGATFTAYAVSDPDTWSVLVDAFDGRPVSVSRADLVTGPGPRLTDEAAVGRALAWLVERAIPIPVADPVVEAVDHGELQSIRVTWQGRSGQALAPDLRVVEVEAVSGTVVRVLDQRLPYAAAPEPAVTVEAAVEAARALAGDPAATLEGEPVLRILVDGAGAQSLAWEVRLLVGAGAGYDSLAIIRVDAMTGEATLLGAG